MSGFTRKDFRDHLNREHPAPPHRNGVYRQRTRPYGDYLWHQDREKFEADYADWMGEKVGAFPRGSAGTRVSDSHVSCAPQTPRTDP